jgi:hypothetical protein
MSKAGTFGQGFGATREGEEDEEDDEEASIRKAIELS